jgi:hypothetical protein
VRHWDFGASIGFPVIKDHLWFFGSAVNADRINRYYAGTTDRATANPNYFGKINAQYKNTRAEFVANWNNYEILGIIYSPYANTKRDLFTPTAYYTAQLNQVIGKLMISAKYSLMKNKEKYHAGVIPFDDPYSLKTGNTYYKPGWATSWNGAYPQRYYATPNGANSSSYREQKRPFVMVDGTYFAENVLGGDHEIKLGVEWEKPYYFLIGGSPNQMWVYVNYPDAIAPGGKATFFQTQRNNYRDLWTSRTGFFFQDIVTFKRFTASFGLRYDTHTMSWGEAGCPKWSSVNPDGSAFAFGPWEKYLVAYNTPAGEAPQKIGGWSPRFNLSYDLTGDGKNVVKLALAHYGGVVGNREINLAALYPGASMPYLRSPFDDKNGNYWPDPGEFTFYTPAEMQQIQAEKKLVSYNWYQYFFMNNDGPIPAAESAAIVDPDFKAPAIDEILLSYERQLAADMVLRANAIYRKNYNAMRYPVIHYWGTKASPVVESADSYEVITTDPATGRNAYRLKPSLGAYTGNYLTNFKKSSSDYKGLRFEFNKLMSHRWMLNAALELSLARFRADPSDCFGTFRDNLEYFDGGPFLPLATLWALTGGPANASIASSDWQFKINGLYQLPWGITISGVFTGRQGWPVPEYGAVYSGTYLAKKGAKFGDVRLKDLFILDLALEKTFTIGATTRVLLIANVYNAFNNSNIIQVNNSEIPQNLTPLQIVRPGIVQLGFRVKF